MKYENFLLEELVFALNRSTIVGTKLIVPLALPEDFCEFVAKPFLLEAGYGTVKWLPSHLVVEIK